MQSIDTNRKSTGPLPGMSGTIKLLAVQLLLVSVLVAALVAIRGATASADTGDAALTHQALAAVHNRNGPADPSDEPTALQRPLPVIDINPDLLTPPRLRSAA